MFASIVAGADDRAVGGDALALAGQLASHDAQLTLAYVQVGMPEPEPEAGAVLTRHSRHAMEQLAALRDEARDDTRVVLVEAGSVATGLHELAVRHAADLLVIGSTRRDDYERALVGDDTRGVLANAPCAVAVAPAGYAARPPRLTRIGAAYDGSRGGEQALAVARSLARERDAGLSVFEAVPEPLLLDDPWDPQPELDAGVAEARRRLARLGDVELHVASGDAVEQLTRYGASVDLLVVGPHSHRPIDRVLGASTAQRLAGATACPLLVLAASPEHGPRA